MLLPMFVLLELFCYDNHHRFGQLGRRETDNRLLDFEFGAANQIAHREDRDPAVGDHSARS